MFSINTWMTFSPSPGDSSLSTQATMKSTRRGQNTGIAILPGMSRNIILIGNSFSIYRTDTPIRLGRRAKLQHQIFIFSRNRKLNRLIFQTDMNTTAKSLARKIAECLFVCLVSVYLTFLVDIFTLNNNLKRAFIFGYFAAICALFLCLKKCFLKFSRTGRPVWYTAAVVVLSASVLILFQDTFLPPLRNNLITLQADESGEVWLIEATVDGKLTPLSQLNIAENYNWQYIAEYDDYVYYPGESSQNNSLILDIVGSDIGLNFAVNSWSSSVFITNDKGESETIALRTGDAKQSKLTYTETGGRLYSVSEKIIFNLGALLVTVFFMDLIVVILWKKIGGAVPTTVSSSDKFFLAFSVILIIITTAIFKPQLYYEGKEYAVTITSLNDRNSNCQGYEMSFGMKVNGKAILAASKDAGWSESEGSYLCVVPDQSITFILNSVNDNKLTFAQHIYAAKIRVDYFENSKVLDLYSANSQLGEWLFDRECSPKPPLEILFAAVFIAAVILSMSFLMTLIFRSVRAGTAFSVLVSFLAIFCWTEAPQDYYYVIFVLCLICYCHLFGNKGRYIQEYLGRKVLSVITVLISFYTAFALFGFDLFLSGDFWNTSIKSVATYVYFSAMMIPMVLFSLEVLERMKTIVKRRSDIDSEKGCKRFRLKAFMILVIPMIASCIVYYPANMTSDQVDQWIQALGYAPVGNAHPAIHTLFLRLCSEIFPSPATVTIIQSLLLAFVGSAIFDKCYKKGLPHHVLLGCALLFSVMPNTIAMITSITKNIMFAISLLWAIYLLMEAFDNPIHFFKSPAYILQSLIVLPFVHLVRANAFVILPIVGLIFIYFTIKCFKNVRIRPALLLAGVMLIVSAVKGPLYDQFGVVKTEGGSGPIPPLAVYIVPLKFGIELPEDTVAFLEKLLPKEEFIKRYAPYNADVLSWSSPRPNYSKTTTSEALKYYLKLLYQRPDIVIKERLDGANLSWDVFSHAGVKHDRYALGIWGSNSMAGYMENESRTFIPERKSEGSAYPVYGISNSLAARIMSQYLQAANERAFLNSIIWRNGLYLILSLIAAVFALKEKNYKIIVLESIPLSVLGTLMLIFGCQIYQYFWFFPMSILSICLYMLSSQKVGVQGYTMERFR